MLDGRTPALKRPQIDIAGPFLGTVFERNDWIALFLKSYEERRVVQRVGPVSWVRSVRLQRWLRSVNARKFNVFISVNAIRPGCRYRTRNAIGHVRHIFLDVDNDGRAALARIEARKDLPRPSYLLHTSPNHVHILWRVAGFDHSLVERLQKQLARELQTDPAATPVTQNTRLPGFFNHKRTEPHLVTVEYLDITTRYTPDDFPAVSDITSQKAPVRPTLSHGDVSSTERARRYLASVPPAIAGQHGDVHTFRVCCRLVRGFALNEQQALDVLSEWNAGCQPPWAPEELLDKVRRALRYGREPVGGLL